MDLESDDGFVLRYVDWFHACQHLSQAASALFPNDPDRAKRWYSHRLNDLFQGAAASIALELNVLTYLIMLFTSVPTNAVCTIKNFAKTVTPLALAPSKVASNSSRRVSLVLACAGLALPLARCSSSGLRLSTIPLTLVGLLNNFREMHPFKYALLAEAPIHVITPPIPCSSPVNLNPCVNSMNFPVQDSSICVIGGGLAGLSAALDLGRWGYNVTILESSSVTGGLASSLIVEGRPIERFYHFICAGDNDLIKLVAELDLDDQIHWVQSKTSFFYQGRLYRFGLPTDLLLFHPVPLLERIRFGLNVIRSRFLKEWRYLDGLSARSWLIQQIGQQAYDAIWDPLLRVKFGDYHDRISAAWIWHRIHRVAASRRHLWESESLGYLERGSETVIEALLAHIAEMPNVKMLTSSRVAQIHTAQGRISAIQLIGTEEIIPCRYVISTAALPALLKIAPDLPVWYRDKYGQIEYLGVVCGLLKLKRRVTDSFWVNVNDPEIPFNGFIEYSNLNKHLGLGQKSILYVPYYLRTTDPRYNFGDDQLRQEFYNGLKRINSDFDESWVEECHISRATHAQAICTVGFADLVPPHETPLDGLYITDSTQFYPEDRTISAAIRLGRRVAQLIHHRQQTPVLETAIPEGALV